MSSGLRRGPGLPSSISSSRRAAHVLMIPRPSPFHRHQAALLTTTNTTLRRISLASSSIRHLRSSTRAQIRAYATGSSSGSRSEEADRIIDEITEQYSTAKDEFEMAAEETEKKTVYAAEDRAAAAEECAKLKDLYEGYLKSSASRPELAEEIRRRAGQRVRELDEAVKGLEASAAEGG